MRNKDFLITDSPPPSGGGCFPSLAKVKMQTGNYVTMSELQIGDRVKAGRCIEIHVNIIKF